MFCSELAILIQKQIQQRSRFCRCTGMEGFAIHPQPNEAVLEQSLSQWTGEVLQELSDSFS